MRQSTLGACAFVALLALAGCKQEAKFSRAAPQVGTKLKDEQKFEMKMTMTMTGLGEAPQTTEVSRREATEMSKEILALDKDAPTRMKVSYQSKSLVQTERGEEHTLDSELVGKTFIAELKDGQITITDENGKPVDANAARLVAKDANDLGQADQFVVNMPDRAIKVGDEVPELGKLIEAELVRSAGEKSKPDIKAVSVKLRDEKGGVAFFDVALSLTQVQGPTSMSTDLKGTMGVRRNDSRPVQLTLSGPVKIALSSGNTPMKMEGSGTMTLERQVSWQ